MTLDEAAIAEEAGEPLVTRRPRHNHRHGRGRLPEQAVPVLGRIRTWLDAESHLVLSRSPMAVAITYTLNQWDALCRYTQQGFLNIDNNAAERALKPVAIGRKNRLFAGNDRAGQTAATLYSLIASAERHGLDPQRYLTGVLANIASTPVSQVGQFLADGFK